MERKAVPAPAPAKPAARAVQRSASKTAATGPSAASALQAARGGGRSAGSLLALQRVVGNRAALQLMPARVPGPRDSDMAGGGAKEKLGGSGHNPTPTPGDSRNHAEMRADVDGAIAEAQVHAEHPRSTVESVERALPEIQERHGLRSLELEPTGGGHAVVGKLNPSGKGDEVELPFGDMNFGEDEPAEEEAHGAPMSESLAAMKAKEREDAEKAKKAKAERSGNKGKAVAEAHQAAQVEAAKPHDTHYIYPSEMTGDIWHAASALILNPRSTVHFITPDDVQSRSYEGRQHALNRKDEASIETLKKPADREKLRKADVGIGQLKRGLKNASKRDRPRLRDELRAAKERRGRIHEAMESPEEIQDLRRKIHSRNRNVKHLPTDRAKWVKHRAANEKALEDFGLGDRHEHHFVDSSYRTGVVTKHGKDAVTEEAAKDKSVRSSVLDQKKTTSAVMAAIKKDGPAKVVAKLRKGLAGGADDAEKAWVDAEIVKIRARVAALRKDSGKKKAKLLMINRREGHENMQHNTSDAQFAHLTQWYGETHLAGKSPAIHAQATMGVATGAKPQPGDLDLYDQAIEPSLRPKGTKRRTALLWARIADLQKEGLVHGLIGGRSGSMDIAAFMGVNAYSWDDHQPDNVDYQRLKETEPELMTVGHMQGDDHALDQGHVKGWMNPPPSEEKVALQKKLSNLDKALAQLRNAAKSAPKKQKAALRAQIVATTANRKKVQTALTAAR